MQNSNSNTIKTLTSIIVGLVVIAISLSLFLFYTMAYGNQKQVKPIDHPTTELRPKHQRDISLVFRNNCASCHALNKDLIGPALGGISHRLPSEQWFNDYVTNEKDLRKSNGNYINQSIQNKIDNNWSHQFNHLSQEDLMDLKTYIQY